MINTLLYINIQAQLVNYMLVKLVILLASALSLELWLDRSRLFINSFSLHYILNGYGYDSIYTK